MGKRSREKIERRLMGELEPEKEKSGINREAICKKIILVGTFLILFTPLIISSKFFFPFVGPKSLYFMGLVEIIFFAWLFLIIFNPRYRPRLNPLLIALILFLLVLIFAAIFGVDPFNSFWSKFERMTGILMMLHLLAFFLVISTVFEKSDWDIIFAVSIAVGVIISFIALISTNPSMRGGATIGNDSFLGTYLLFDLFLALYLILKSKIGLKIYSSICFLIMALELILGGARAAKLSLVIGLILLFFLWLTFYHKGKLKWVGISILILSVISVLVFTFFAFQPESFVRKEIIEKTVGETFGGRFIVWQGAWKSFLERPLLGWGLENFEFAFTKNYNPCMGTTRCGSDLWYDRAHNIIFDTLVSSGILGLISYLGIFIAAFYFLWKNYFKGKFDFWISGILTALLISYFVQNLTVFDMVSSYMIFFLVLGFMAANSREPKEFQIVKKTKSPYLLVAAILLVALYFSLSNFVIRPLKTDAYIIEAFSSSAIGDRISLYQETLATSPVGRYQIREFFVEQLMSFLQREEASKVATEKITQELDFLSQELEKSTKESPLDYRAHLKLGQIYNIYSLFDSTKLSLAEATLEKTISLSPTDQQGYWSLAQTKLYEGETEEALALAEKALELDKHLDRSYLVLVQVAVMIGDYDLAKKKAQEAIEINPTLESTLKSILGEQ
jgi:O-antigen ligase